MTNQYRVVDGSYKTYGIFGSKTAAAAFIKEQRAAGKRDLGMVPEDAPKKIKGTAKPKAAKPKTPAKPKAKAPKPKAKEPAKPKTPAKPKAKEPAKPKTPAKPRAAKPKTKAAPKPRAAPKPAPRERIGPARPYFEAGEVALYRDGSLRGPVIRTRAGGVQIWLPAIADTDRRAVTDVMKPSIFSRFGEGSNRENAHLAAAIEMCAMLRPDAFSGANLVYGRIYEASGRYPGGTFTAQWLADTGRVAQMIFRGDEWNEMAEKGPKAKPKAKAPAKPKAAPKPDYVGRWLNGWDDNGSTHGIKVSLDGYGRPIFERAEGRGDAMGAGEILKVLRSSKKDPLILDPHSQAHGYRIKRSEAIAAMERKLEDEGRAGRYSPGTPAKPKAAPRPAAPAKPAPREMIGPGKPKAAAKASAPGRDFKPLLDAFAEVSDTMPLASGWGVDDSHVMAMVLSYPRGGFLGMGWGDGEALDLGTVSGLTVSDVYTAERSEGRLIFRGRSKTVSARTVSGEPRRPLRMAEAHIGFEMDAKAFQRELRRAGIIVGAGAKGWSESAYLYEDQGDLMLKVVSGLAELDADVGDARSVSYQDAGAHALFDTQYLARLARIMSHADGPCRLYIGKGAPLRAEMSICGVGAAVYIAPRRE